MLISNIATALDIMLLKCFFKKNSSWMNANAGDGMVTVFGTAFFSQDVILCHMAVNGLVSQITSFS